MDTFWDILDTTDLFCIWHSLRMFIMRFIFFVFLPLVGHWLARCEDRNLFRPSCVRKKPEHPALFVSFLQRLRWHQDEFDWQIRLGFFAEILPKIGWTIPAVGSNWEWSRDAQALHFSLQNSLYPTFLALTSCKLLRSFTDLSCHKFSFGCDWQAACRWDGTQGFWLAKLLHWWCFRDSFLVLRLETLV